jgi:hypothetical protein
VTGAEDLEEGEVPAVLDLAILVAIIEFDVLDASLVKGLLSWPLKSLGPGLVSEPIADEVSITSIDQNWDLLKDTRDEAVERLHPITLKQEVSVDVEIAGVVAADFRSEGVQDILSVQVLADIAKGRVAKVALVLTLATDIVNVLASSLVWPNHGIVAIDTGGDARPDALAVVAILDETLAAGKCVVHCLAFALRENSWVTTLSAGHWLVVFVLGQAISETVANEDGLQVDVALLVGKDFGGENWNVVTSVRFTSDVEVLLGVLWELLEEEGEESVHILSSCDSVADRAAAV